LTEKNMPESVKSVIDSEFSSLIPTSTSSEDFNSSFLARHSASPSHILGSARGILEITRQSEPLQTETVGEIAAVLDKLVAQDVPPRVEAFVEGVALLKEAGAGAEEIEKFEKKVKERVPLAEMFAPEEERKKRREEIMAVPEEKKA
jgi:hypothetical protein